MTGISHVTQTDSHGCVFASLAMLLGRSYEDIKDEIRARYGEPDKALATGVTYLDAMEFLHDAGYYCQLKYKWFFDNRQREIWPPEPWAPIHYCEVVVSATSGGSHAVVMLEDGQVLDPLTPEPKRLTDYEKTNLVVGLVPV